MTFEHLKKLVDMMFVPDGSGGVLQRYDKIDPKTLNPLVLAYIGDAYFHLFIRGRILSYEQNKVQVLNQFSAQIVSAVWQDKAYRAIEPMLTEEEKAIYKRGRNAKSHAPRSATVAQYHSSTGFEALLGSLYLQEKNDRLYEIAEASFQVISKAMMNEISSR
ncbi:MAG: ribonuclease III [Selenomonadales bacterium]|nr:ribonuclease III [Selenomonadales bacterium]MDY3740793.1 ribonuclease III domain-containing protein [Selenomonadaceae bacterium]MEE1361937.1 ribonuclease III domain-containing protein [Selenomonadaceae bacterium]